MVFVRVRYANTNNTRCILQQPIKARVDDVDTAILVRKSRSAVDQQDLLVAFQR
jgi:hypothetical protein